MPQPLSKAKFNPDELHLRAQRQAEETDIDMCRVWLEHPCTKTLLLSLEGDMCGLAATWIGGGYSNEESIDATAQLSAKARGQVQTLDDIIETIGQIGNKTFGDE